MIICQKCGDGGDQRKLVYCVKCDATAEHRYCLDEMPKADEELDWMCYDCTPAEARQLVVVNPSRKSERICSKREVKQSRMEMHKQNSKTIAFSLKEERAVEARAFCRLPEATLPKGVKAQDTDNEGPKAREGARKRRRFIIPDEDSDEQYNLCNVEADQPSCNQVPVKNELQGEGERMALERGTKHAPSCIIISRNQKHQALEMGLIHREGECRDESKPDEVEACRGAINNPLHTPYLEPEKYVPARPADHPIWKGRCNVTNATTETKFGIWAYVSTKASHNVHAATRTLPFSLEVEKTSRRPDAWPNSFNASPPTVDCIGIYLYPISETDERVFDGLITEMIEQDLALKTSINDNVELLVFSSFLLPPESRRRCRKYFL